MPWFPRRCTWCGVQLAARTDDPGVIVACLACDDSPDLPLEPDGSDIDPARRTGLRPPGGMTQQEPPSR